MGLAFETDVPRGDPIRERAAYDPFHRADSDSEDGVPCVPRLGDAREDDGDDATEDGSDDGSRDDGRGTGDPAETEEWIRAMERIFRFLRCNDAERLMCVSYQLKGTADYWWEAKQKTMAPEQLDELTWELFKTAMCEKFIPRSYRKKKEMEFTTLKQGNKIVVEYDRLFCDLARYAPYRVDTDEKMSELFCAGLRQEIRVVLASQTALSYAEALNRALDMELAMQPEKATHALTPPSAQYTQVSNTPYSNQGQKGKRK
ncbi:uncharacterized protein LOC131003361 [Salvia miltiorrhiza]|uniref:uncharacterized protein LOC131003361 n=1 Tax=Salvia miltiorrhiza TaxID=226208 RepID=UPI0025AD2635|nr:uncharacterized protein LOC131003361 [Salvia miltiorrhiza]